MKTNFALAVLILLAGSPLAMGYPMDSQQPDVNDLFKEEVLGSPMSDVLEPLSPSVSTVNEQVFREAPAVETASAPAPGTGTGEVPLPQQFPEQPVADTTTTTVKPEVKESLILGLQWYIFLMLVIIILVVIGVLIWLVMRHKKKQALKAGGCNAEVVSKTPVTLPTGEAAAIVNIQPVSDSTSGGL